jgi:colanic acid biosynthesis glycosyl transferase WcaI
MSDGETRSNRGQIQMPQDAETPKTQPDILIYGMNYAPEMTGVGRYSGEIGAYLAERGYTVRVVTTPPHYPGWRVDPPYSALGYHKEVRDGVAIWRCPIVLGKTMRGIWRLVAPASFVVASAPLALWTLVVGRPRIVLCVEPTLMAAPIALLARLYGARVVLHVQDLEVDAAFAMGYLKGARLRRFVHLAEAWLLRRFSAIVTISSQMAKRLAEKGLDSGRIGIVRNWVDLGKIKPLPGPNGLRTELGLEDKHFVVLYAGNIGAKQSLDVVLEAAREIGGRDDIWFVIAGDGPEKPRLAKDYADVPHVAFLPLQPEERLCELLNLADLHVLPQSRGAADLVLPSKLGGMLASGKPVLVTADPGTELFDVLDGTAILVPAGDSAAIAREIRTLASSGVHPSLGDGRALAKSFSREPCLEAFHAVLVGETFDPNEAVPRPLESARSAGPK